MNHTADLGTSTTLDIDNSSHGGTSTRKSTEETSNSVADALSNKFFIAVMLSLSDVVSHY